MSHFCNAQIQPSHVTRLVQTVYIYTVYNDCICGDSPAKHTVYTPNMYIWFWPTLHMTRVGQNRIYTPYMTVYLMISLPKTPYIHCIYMVLANPTHDTFPRSHVAPSQTATSLQAASSFHKRTGGVLFP
jgi:hypothetical protein